MIGNGETCSGMITIANFYQDWYFKHLFCCIIIYTISLFYIIILYYYTILDVNECILPSSDPMKHLCGQQCINLEGTYRCTCEEGFILDDDGYTCNGISMTTIKYI